MHTISTERLFWIKIDRCASFWAYPSLLLMTIRWLRLALSKHSRMLVLLLQEMAHLLNHQRKTIAYAVSKKIWRLSLTQKSKVKY